MMLRNRPSQYLAATALLICLCLSAIPTFAAVTARISGTVKDPSGAVVGGASVTAIDTDTGIKEGVRADAQGFYSFPSLPVGHYDIEVQASGFKVYRQKGLLLDVNTALTVDVALELGSASQEVTVQAQQVQVETTNTQMGEVISNTKMTTVPLNGRSYTDLLALQPGVSPTSSGQYSANKCVRQLESRQSLRERAKGIIQWVHGEWWQRQ